MKPFTLIRAASLLYLVLATTICVAQENQSISHIIDRIYELEKDKDPKCYATANRLEDFMFGTPLNEDARNLKIEIQKELILYLKREASKHAVEVGVNKIRLEDLNKVTTSLARIGKNKEGDYLYQIEDGTILIKKKDFRQYSSVSYTYRSMLSLEQDLLFLSESNTLSFNEEATKFVNDYVNLVTLVTLKVADGIARKRNQTVITKDIIKDSWVFLLNATKRSSQIANQYPKVKRSKSSKNNNTVLHQIIEQKLASYQKYNELSTKVFLRNIQVYFARQKWPTDIQTSDQLKNYYLESLISFAGTILKISDDQAAGRSEDIIRVQDVRAALKLLLPELTNSFEDVTFFPNNPTENITVESYDLDAFRDGGLHWQILKYALDDAANTRLKSVDPNAAELAVEGIAQLGVLVLRLAGEHSHKDQKKVLDKKDIETAFITIQGLIDSYASFPEIKNNTAIVSTTESTSIEGGFRLIQDDLGIKFDHKSSDWLSRHIRSYSTSYKEKTIKLAIPPAFGGAGVATEDVNNDGLPDVLLLSGFGNKLFLNTSEGAFKDVSTTLPLNPWNDELNSYGEPRQPIIADFNNDGLQDIFISYVNQQHQLLKNTGNGTFEDVSDMAQLGGKKLVAGPATTIDYDNDGLLDIFIGYFGNYVEGTLPTLSRDNQNGSPNKLFKNMGNFVFKEVPFTEDVASNTGWTQAVGHADINQDGLQDLIVGNDFGVNKYYLNTKEGLFKEVSKQLGTDKPSYTMNVGITDLNGDLYPDFYISNIVVMQKDEKYVSPNEDTTMKFDPEKMANIRTVEANDLFLSNVSGKQLGSYQLSNNVGRGYSSTGWSWDADFFDYDNDGDEDLYCLNGMNDFSVYSSENPFYFERKEQSKSIQYAESNREKNVFFVNEGGTLINRASELGTDQLSNARSASYFDYDQDGDLDIIVNNYHDQAHLLENNAAKGNNWIKIKLIGNPEKGINRDAIGSSMVINSKNHKNIWREVHSTLGYLSVHPKEQHFGLGSDTKAEVEVRWSNGEVFVLKGLQSNTAYEVSYPNILSVKK